MQVTLRNIKGVKHLHFEMPDPGVWVMAGLNGCGKTSLFAALHRLGTPNAYQRYFRSGSSGARVDRYVDAEVEYKIEGSSVTYRYGGQRWQATPKRNASLLANAPYEEIIYVEANAARIEPTADEIRNKRRKSCSDEICEFAEFVLGDCKWADLKYVNTRRGGGSRAYLIPFAFDGQTHFYSEKSFSLGELCVLKLGVRLAVIPDNSLVLIDEIEMALHPQAQVRLMRKLQEVAKQKNLTILFSTHSATIIKSATRAQLIYLLRETDGRVLVTYEPYPALVLGDVAFADELAADYVFYVEDREAKLLLESMLGVYMARCHADPANAPLYRVVPIGGYPQVVEMLSASSFVLPSHVKRLAFFDADARQPLNDALREAREPLASTYRRVRADSRFLPCAPEQGLVEHLENDVLPNQERLREYERLFAGNLVRLTAILTSQEYLNLTNPNPRKQAKLRINHLASVIVNETGIDEIQVRRTLYGKYTEHTYPPPHAALRELLGPIVNAR